MNEYPAYPLKYKLIDKSWCCPYMTYQDISYAWDEYIIDKVNGKYELCLSYRRKYYLLLSCEADK